MIKYRKYGERIRIFAENGQKFKQSYIPHIRADGELELEPAGVVCTYDEIQAQKNSVDIHYLMERFRLTGDRSIFDRVTGIYGDVSEIPTNYADILNLRLRMEREFEALPASYKVKFDNDINKYVARYGSDEWFKALDLVKPVPDAEISPVEPIKESE